MPVRGSSEVRRNMRRVTRHITQELTPTVVKEVLIIGEGYAAALTPIDTSNLINSGFRTVTNTATGTVGVVGYTADYAIYVHEASGKLKGEPRSSVDSFSTRDGRTAFSSNSGNFWDPDAEPQFLTKGFERDGLPEIEAHIKRRYQK